jgi:hypothetical protein
MGGLKSLCRKQKGGKLPVFDFVGFFFDINDVITSPEKGKLPPAPTTERHT